MKRNLYVLHGFATAEKLDVFWKEITWEGFRKKLQCSLEPRKVRRIPGWYRHTCLQANCCLNNKPPRTIKLFVTVGNTVVCEISSYSLMIILKRKVYLHNRFYYFSKDKHLLLNQPIHLSYRRLKKKQYTHECTHSIYAYFISGSLDILLNKLWKNNFI